MCSMNIETVTITIYVFFVQDEVPTKLFIGRLPTGTTTQQLSDHFEEYGPLKDVYIPKNFRGFGFVTFSSKTQAHAAMSVTHQLNVSYRIVMLPRVSTSEYYMIR